MKSILLLLLSFSALSGDISMLGIKINYPSDYKISLQAVNSKDGITKYKTQDGNYLSITTQNGKVVYMENDWLHNKTSNHPLLTDFKFGETTLQQIRDVFGTNGFTYKDNAYLKSETNLTTINCFELDSPNNEVIVLITKAPIKDIIEKDKEAAYLLLDAIILCDKKYLDDLWGKKKIYDLKYKKITL